MTTGVYVAAGPNPIFLRLFMAQLARQTQLPNFLSIFENGNATSAFDWACGEIVKELKDEGVTILHEHSSAAANSVTRYYRALKPLCQTPTDVFLKMDLDDFYSDEYVANMSGALGANEIAINMNNAITLVRPFHGDFKYKPLVQMCLSPIGAAPAHVVFNKTFSEWYLRYLEPLTGKDAAADDDVMASVIQKMVKVHRFDGPCDYTYVSHGNNHSSYAWQATGGRIYLD